MSTETKQGGLLEDPDLERKHMENLIDLVPDVVVVEMLPGDVTPPDLCNYHLIGKVKPVKYYDSGPVLTKQLHWRHVC